MPSTRSSDSVAIIPEAQKAHAATLLVILGSFTLSLSAQSSVFGRYIALVFRHGPEQFDIGSNPPLLASLIVFPLAALVGVRLATRRGGLLRGVGTGFLLATTLVPFLHWAFFTRHVVEFAEALCGREHSDMELADCVAGWTAGLPGPVDYIVAGLGVAVLVVLGARCVEGLGSRVRWYRYAFVALGCAACAFTGHRLTEISSYMNDLLHASLEPISAAWPCFATIAFVIGARSADQEGNAQPTSRPKPG